MTLLEDLRYAVRAMRAQLALATTIVTILSVAIGANTAVFALVNTVLLSRLPFHDPDQLVMITQTRADSPNEPLSIPDYRDLRDGNRSFESLAAAFQWSANLTGGEPERLQGMRASASLFSMLGASAALGRTLMPEDEAGAGARVVVLTHGLWTRRFGGRADAIGSTLILNGDAYIIVGVLPRRFITPIRDAELVTPFPMESDPRRLLRDSGFLRVIGRLRPGVRIEQARDDLDAIMARLRAEYPLTNATHLGTAIVEWRSVLGSRQRSLLLLLQAAVALVMIVACANVANLLLAASVRREHEFAVRAALGASRLRLVRQVLAETLLIAAASVVCAIAIQAAAGRALIVLAPADLLALSPASAANPRVLLFTLAVAIGATLLSGLVPAVRLGGSGTLRSGRTASPANRRLRELLVGAEVAVASLLIAMAILLSQSFEKLQSVDPGFRADHLLTARLSLPRPKYPRTADTARFVERLRPRLLALPGVQDAAAVNVIPLNNYHATADVWPTDRPAPGPGQMPQAEYRMVSPSYIPTFRVPLLAGRPFDEHDDAAGEPVVLISRTLAVRFWTVPDAIGKSLIIEDGETPRQARIVGVVGDVKHYGLDAELTPDIYTPIPQVPTVTVQWLNNNMYWGVRTTADPNAMREAFRAALKEIDPDVPASAVRSMDEALAVALAPRRTNLGLVRTFAVLALLLATAGVYAVTAFTVALRRREIAIRAALGARRIQTITTIVADAIRPVLAGLLAGAAGAVIAAPALRAVLFEVNPFAVRPYSLVFATLLVAGVASALVAALPVRRINPIEALEVDPR